MVTPRVVLGKQNDGVTYGLRCTMPGYSADTGDGSGGEFTFNSDWTDITKIHQTGVLSYSSGFSAEVTLGNTITVPGYKATYSDPGYYPFVEARRISSNVVYDDFWTSSQVAGLFSGIRRTYFFVRTDTNADFPAANAMQILYVVYKQAIPATAN